MLLRCLICTDVLAAPAHPKPAYCVICAHRTTRADRRDGRPAAAGFMDAA
jgi:hypothetical protein